MRFLALLWGLVAYVAFWAALVWTIVFLAYNVVPQKYQERLYTALPFAADIEGGESVIHAYAMNGGLLAAFIIPNLLIGTGCCAGFCASPLCKATARSTHVLVSSLLLGLLVWKWKLIPEVVWFLPQYKAPLQSLFWGGWGLALLGSFLVGHFHLTGLRQVFWYFRGREDAPGPGTSRLAQLGRHLVLIGLLLGLLATPKMTLGHLMFGVPMATFVALRWAQTGRQRLPTTQAPPAGVAG